MFRRTSKHPEIFVRLDVRLNVLEFSNVYTYFLGRLDVNPKKFLIYTGCAEDDDDDENYEDDGLDCMDCIHNDDDDDENDEDDCPAASYTHLTHLLGYFLKVL